MLNDNSDIVITIIALVIGLTLVAVCLVCFHIKKAREENNNSLDSCEGSANERNRRQAHYRRLLRQRMERELSMQQNRNSQIDPPSYHVAIDIIDPRPPPPTYGQHRRDTRIASSTQQQQQ